MGQSSISSEITDRFSTLSDSARYPVEKVLLEDALQRLENFDYFMKHYTELIQECDKKLGEKCVEEDATEYLQIRRTVNYIKLREAAEAVKLDKFNLQVRKYGTFIREHKQLLPDLEVSYNNRNCAGSTIDDLSKLADTILKLSDEAVAVSEIYKEKQELTRNATDFLTNSLCLAKQDLYIAKSMMVILPELLLKDTASYKRTYDLIATVDNKIELLKQQDSKLAKIAIIESETLIDGIYKTALEELGPVEKRPSVCRLVESISKSLNVKGGNDYDNQEFA